MRGKRVLRRASGLVLAFALAGSAARADTGAAKHFFIELDAGAAFVQEEGFGNGLRYGLGAFFRTGKRTGMEVFLERFSVPIEEGTAGLAAGRMDMTSILFNIQVYLTSRGRILPYLLTGIGFSFIGYSPDGPTTGPEMDFVDRMALQLGGGLDFCISPRLVLSGKARYHLVRTWAEELPRTVPIREIDPLAQNIQNLYTLELGLVLRFAF